MEQLTELLSHCEFKTDCLVAAKTSVTASCSCGSMMVCSQIRSSERVPVVVDTVRILVEELLEEGDGGMGIMVWLYVGLGESSTERMVGCVAWDRSILGGWKP